MRSTCLAAVVVLFGCAHAARGAKPAAGVTWSEVVPVGYESLGRVHAECGPRAAWGSMRGASATSLFCGQAELERALVEQAEDKGGTVLAERRCLRLSGELLTCSAFVARPAADGAPALRAAAAKSAVDSDTLSAEIARRISIDLEPSVTRFARRSRPGADVRELSFLPVGDIELGVMRARCSTEACDAEQTRAGLRAAAGALGVPDLVGVRCSALDSELTCVATLAATERDPETDPRAR